MIRGFILTITASIALATSAHAELTLCNRTSYRMEVAIGLEKRANVETRGWFRLDPGQCRQALDGTLDADMVYLHARTPPLYGGAPFPLNGQADFCVKSGDFEIPNARSCPTSQQAQFSAAKPSESPKGPVINLAEEADYDDVQARLAGIQRLLVIAGYDAYPIDGVQGAKTQAAVAKFLPLTHALAVIRYGLVDRHATGLHDIWGMSNPTAMAALSLAVVAMFAALFTLLAVRAFKHASLS